MDHKAGNQLPHGWMMGFSTVQVENNCGGRQHRVLRICLQYAVTGGLPQYEGLPPLNREETSATGNR